MKIPFRIPLSVKSPKERNCWQVSLSACFGVKKPWGHPVESIMYGIPLGLMSAALLPFRDKLSFQSAREMKDYVRSFIAGTIVHQAQQGEKKKIVEYYGNRGGSGKTR